MTLGTVCLFMGEKDPTFYSYPRVYSGTIGNLWRSILQWQTARTVTGSTEHWSFAKGSRREFQMHHDALLFGIFFLVLIGIPSALYQSIVPFIKKSSIAPKEIAIGFSPKGWGCCRLKSLFLLHGIYHPGVDRLVKLGPKAWNASLLKCLLEEGGAMGGGLLLL